MLISTPSRDRPGQPEHGTSTALAVIGLALAIVTAHTALAVDRYDFDSYVHGALVQSFFYALAVALLLWQRGCGSNLFLILVTAIILRGIAMTTEPGLTSDAYRYVWDGRLTLAGFSPYLHIPADEQLAAFRDPAVFPHINQRDTAFTIYPPAAQLVFAAGAWLDRIVGTGADAGHNGMKAIMALFEVATISALLVWLRTEGLPPERVLIYAWHPLPIWEFASQIHIDAAATTLLLLGVLAAVRSRQGLAGVLLALAALVKYFPVVLIPALWKRWDWRMPTAFIATAAILYAPHVITAGTKVVGFVANHLDNEGYKQGWGFHVVWFLREFRLGDLSGTTYAMVALAGLGVLAFISLFARGNDEIRPGQLVALAAAFIWLTSSHYAWYFGWLIPLLVVFPHPAALLMTLTAAALHHTRPPGGPTWTALYMLVYWAPLLLFIALETWRFARHSHDRSN